MKELTVKLYAFDELSDEAKENAIEKARERNCDEYWYSVSEEISALSDIARTMGADNEVDYEFSICSPSYIRFSFGDIADELRGMRALKYIYNNFISPFIKGKHYSMSGKYINGKYNYKYKHSKSTFEFTPASGMTIDYIVFDTYKEYVENIRKHISFNVADFIEDIESKLAKIIVDNAEYNDSNEVWKERLLDDDREIYTEEGEIY